MTETTQRLRDVYDDDVDFLCHNFGPDDWGNALEQVWGLAGETRGGTIFLWCAPDPHNHVRPLPEVLDLSATFGNNCGCLTQVKSGDSYAYDRGWTERVRADPAVPNRPERIGYDGRRAVLEHLADLQREMDARWPGRYERVRALHAECAGQSADDVLAACDCD